jgi:diaminopimelate epimerase
MIGMYASPNAFENGRLHLSKYQGAGNDFLVLVDLGDELELDRGLISWLCDRHIGVGADGVIRVGGGTQGAHLTMDLHNADGSVAEMSGNGLRCLAHAAVRAGAVDPPQFSVATLAGVRGVDYVAGVGLGPAYATTDMGPVTLGEDETSRFAPDRARRVDVGNPHLVVLCVDPGDIDLARVGREIEARYPMGMNVEFISVSGDDELTLRVWERGVGETLACGTGTCAAAAAARAWGRVGPHVLVHNPGGTLEVTLGAEETDSVLLGGPVDRVADIVVDLGPAGLGLRDVLRDSEQDAEVALGA